MVFLSPVGHGCDKRIVDLVLRFSKENPSWGYDRIQGALANVGYEISDRTVGNILKAHGIEPAPRRQRTGSWSTFLKAHWDVLAAIDFTTVEVWTKGGLVTFYLLFVMELKTRRVHFAGCTVNPHEAWMKQTARELTNFEDGFLNGKRYILMDRDGKFCPAFRNFLKNEDVKPVRLPARSPNSQRLHGKVFWIAQVRVSGSYDLFWRAIATACGRRPRPTLASGEKSPRHGEPSLATRQRSGNFGWSDPMP